MGGDGLDLPASTGKVSPAEVRIRSKIREERWEGAKEAINGECCSSDALTFIMVVEAEEVSPNP